MTKATVLEWLTESRAVYISRIECLIKDTGDTLGSKSLHGHNQQFNTIRQLPSSVLYCSLLGKSKGNDYYLKVKHTWKAMSFFFNFTLKIHLETGPKICFLLDLFLLCEFTLIC